MRVKDGVRQYLEVDKVCWPNLPPIYGWNWDQSMFKSILFFFKSLNLQIFFSILKLQNILILWNNSLHLHALQQVQVHARSCEEVGWQFLHVGHQCEIRSYNNVRIGGEGGWVAVSKSNQNQFYQTRSAPRHTIRCGEVVWQFLGHLWLEKTTPTACTGAAVWKWAGNYISLVDGWTI